MEDLLRLITSNPILLFFIIGAILSFLQKGKEQETKREKRAPNSPVEREQRRDEVDWREIFRQEAKTEKAPKKVEQRQYSYTEEVKTAPPEDVNRTNELLKKYEKAKRNKERAEKYNDLLKNSPIQQGDITRSNQVQLDFSNITKEEIVKGVVWSEVLGKPRAKGSYRPSYYGRRKQG